MSDFVLEYERHAYLKSLDPNELVHLSLWR